MAKTSPVQYPALPTKISEINKAYTKDYIAEEAKAGRLSRKQIEDLRNSYLSAKKESGGRYFIPYRKQFCRVCFPNLYKPSNKDDMEAFFKNLLGE